ncbi:hypothetical protein QX776_08040 [Alteromonadaceae bacterium BrNp21-10]|nr:hypothetical protein [Alteromonadaceae bacterium BrNp21-10]
MSNPDFEQQLKKQIDQLSQSTAPNRDLWPGIEMAISREQSTKPRPYWAIAAGVAMLCGVGWMTLQMDPTVSANKNLVVVLSAQHQQQMQALMVSYQDQPALTDNWQQQLQQLDEAALAIKKALQQEPQNVALLKMLQQVHQQQIDLIEKVHSPKWQQI